MFPCWRRGDSDLFQLAEPSELLGLSTGFSLEKWMFVGGELSVDGVVELDVLFLCKVWVHAV